MENLCKLGCYLKKSTLNFEIFARNYYIRIKNYISVHKNLTMYRTIVVDYANRSRNQIQN